MKSTRDIESKNNMKILQQLKKAHITIDEMTIIMDNQDKKV
jgi:hypothetical protein